MSSASIDTVSIIPTSILSKLPSNLLSLAVFEHAQTHLDPSILAHSLRVYLYAYALAIHLNSCYAQPSNLPILFAACLFHDIATCPAHTSTHERFEVESADLGSALLASHGRTAAECHDVWVAIACHTSPGIAERISPLANLIRVGVTVDFGAAGGVEGWIAPIDETEILLPRARIENKLADAVIAHCANDVSKKAPKGSWAWSLYSAWMENPGWEGVNKGF